MYLVFVRQPGGYREAKAVENEKLLGAFETNTPAFEKLLAAFEAKATAFTKLSGAFLKDEKWEFGKEWEMKL